MYGEMFLFGMVMGHYGYIFYESLQKWLFTEHEPATEDVKNISMHEKAEIIYGQPVFKYELRSLISNVTKHVDKNFASLEDITDCSCIYQLAQRIAESERIDWDKEATPMSMFVDQIQEALMIPLPAEITVDYMVRLHSIACRGVDMRLGNLRDHIGMAGMHVFPHVKYIKNLLERLLMEFNELEQKTTVAVASMFIMQLLSIHPFSYANGITARIMFYKITMKMTPLDESYNDYVKPLVNSDPISFYSYCMQQCYKEDNHTNKERIFKHYEIDFEDEDAIFKYELVKNSAKCLYCGDVLNEPRNRMKTCTCDALSIDGGLMYSRRLCKDINGVQELSEYRLSKEEY